MFRSACLILLLVFCDYVVAQNKALTEELIVKLELDTLSEKARLEIARQLAHDHPDAGEAMRYADMAIQIAIELADSLDIARAYEEKSATERLIGNHTAAMNYALKALKIFEDLGDLERVASAYAQLGANQVNLGETESALGFLSKAKNMYEEIGDHLRFMLSHINLGEAYRFDNQLDSAIYHFSEALKLNNEPQNRIVEGYARGNLGMALRSKGELKQAKTELTRANEILTELGDPYSVSVYTADLAQISVAEGKPTLAEEQLLTAYNMAKREGLKEQIRDFSEMLVSFYESRNDFEQALGYQKVYQVYQDSLVNKENVQEMERIQANYQIEKREDQIDLLEKLSASQQTFNIALGGGLLIFGILAAMLYQSNKQKREANAMLGKQQLIVEKREEEKAILLKELNHRVKNNLQMVSSLLSLQGNQLGDHPAAEAINAGKLRVEALSMIHQKLYQDDVHTSINIKEHLVLLVSNLMYSYGDPFEPVIKVTPAEMEMDIDTAIPLSLIVNELVTNAMKYAYEGIENPEMDISLDKSNGLYHLDFSDNGVGIDQEKDTSNSFGIRLIKSLVAQLKGTLEFSNIPTGGTNWVITLELPNA